jgi:hypothetical protein
MRSPAMDNLGWSILLGGIVIGVMIWLILKSHTWNKLFRKGIIVEGHIIEHRHQHINNGRIKVFSLIYSYDCNETTYFNEQPVDSSIYSSLKDGDRVNVRCLAEDPRNVRLEVPSSSWELLP